MTTVRLNKQQTEKLNHAMQLFIEVNGWQPKKNQVVTNGLVLLITTLQTKQIEQS